MEINRFNTVYSLNNNDKKNINVSFGNGILPGATAFYRSFDANPVAGPTIVDVIAMVVPRTFIDGSRVSEEDKKKGKKTNPDAAFETLSRETAGTFLHCILPGFIALGVSQMLVAASKNPDIIAFRNKVKLSNITIDEKSVDQYTNIWKQNNSKEKFADYIVNNVKGLEDNTFNELSHEHKTSVKNDLIEYFKTQNPTAEQKENVISNFGKALGARKTIRVSTNNGSEYIDTSLKELVGNTHILTNAFEKAPKNLDALKNAISRTIKNKTWYGLGVVLTMAASWQGINRYWTKKRTGKAGFVATGSKEPDKSSGFKLLKTGAAAAMVGILGHDFYKNGVRSGKDLFKALEFKGNYPTVAQAKLLFTFAVCGRLLASGDKNELRETGIRDGLGFFAFYGLLEQFQRLTLKIFGNKGIYNIKPGDNEKVYEAIAGKDYNSIIKDLKTRANAGDEQAKKALKDISKNITLKTIDEVLDKASVQLGISRIGKDGKPVSAIKMVKEIQQHASKGNDLAKEALSKLMKLNIAETGSIVISSLILGMAIPIFNKQFTNKNESKKNNKQGQSVTTNSQQGATNTVNSSKNLSLKNNENINKFNTKMIDDTNQLIYALNNKS